MPDTKKTKGQLLTDMPVNTTGNTSNDIWGTPSTPPNIEEADITVTLQVG